MQNESGATKRKSSYLREQSTSQSLESCDLSELGAVGAKRRTSARLQRLRAEREKAEEDELGRETEPKSPIQEEKVLSSTVSIIAMSCVFVWHQESNGISILFYFFILFVF